MRVVASWNCAKQAKRDSRKYVFKAFVLCVYTLFSLLLLCFGLYYVDVALRARLCVLETRKKNCKAHSFVYIHIGLCASERVVCVYGAQFRVEFCFMYTAHRRRRCVLVCVWVLTPQTLIPTTWVWLTDTVCKQRERETLLTHIRTLLAEQRTGFDLVGRKRIRLRIECCVFRTAS